MKGLFVAGTDTGVGKTFVASALCRALRRSGRRVVGLKPFETGCDPVAADAEALETEARSGVPLELRCPFRYRAPVAPAVAAEREGRPAEGSVFDAAAAALRRAARGRFAVVEAAGGLLVPIDGERTNLDLIATLDLPVILVGRNALGTLNHCGLSVEALRRRRIPVEAIVLSRGRLPADASQAGNARWLRRLWEVPVIELPATTVGRASGGLARQLFPDLAQASAGGRAGRRMAAG